MTTSLKRMCFDRIIKGAQRPRVTDLEGIAPIRSLWTTGTEIHVRFLEGTADQKNKVKQWAASWNQHANLPLLFDDDPQAQIRIAFADDGAWSYVGTDCLGIPRSEPTMNYGWLDEAVVLHEFGHALGLAHEHSSPNGGMQWIAEKVYADLAGPPNHWDKATVDHNVLYKYSHDQVNGTEFDPHSIMLYSFPPSWTTNQFAAGDNQVLSALDKALVTRLYPKAGPKVVDLVVQQRTTTKASIGQTGEEDLFKFKVAAAGLHTIETFGPTDVVMTLYGPDSTTAKVAQDDDGGLAQNSKIVAELRPGTYYVQVRHYNQVNGTGTYEVAVSR